MKTFIKNNRKKLTVGALAILLAVVPAREGLRLLAYKDIAGIPTICFGETRDVKMGMRKTLEECKDMLIPRLEEFNAGVDSCVHVPLSDSRRAALVSFAYNIGIGGFCRSSLVRRLNAGDPKACDSLLQYVYAFDTKTGTKRPIRGLVERRTEEYRLCLRG